MEYGGIHAHLRVFCPRSCGLCPRRVVLVAAAAVGPLRPQDNRPSAAPTAAPTGPPTVQRAAPPVAARRAWPPARAHGHRVRGHLRHLPAEAGGAWGGGAAGRRRGGARRGGARRGGARRGAAGRDRAVPRRQRVQYWRGVGGARGRPRSCTASVRCAAARAEGWGRDRGWGWGWGRGRGRGRGWGWGRGRGWGRAGAGGGAGAGDLGAGAHAAPDPNPSPTSPLAYAWRLAREPHLFASAVALRLTPAQVSCGACVQSEAERTPPSGRDAPCDGVADRHESCLEWAWAGECEHSPAQMLAVCGCACRQPHEARSPRAIGPPAGTAAAGACVDLHDRCPGWLLAGAPRRVH